MCRGRGRGGKGLGMGGAMRHRMVFCDAVQVATKPTVSRRGCAKIASNLRYEEIQGSLSVFVEKTLDDVMLFANDARRCLFVS